VRYAPVGESWELVILAPAALARFLAIKGRSPVNGVSLTVNRVAIPPRAVILDQRHPAHPCGNDSGAWSLLPRELEVDLIARYVERMLPGR